MTKSSSKEEVIMKEVQRILDTRKLISSVLTPGERRELQEQTLQLPVNQLDMYRNQSLTR